MNKKSPLGEITPSICEAAFEEYASLDDSLAELIHRNHIDVRDFIILSFVCDQGELGIEQIAQILGISLSGTGYCIDRLIEADLIQYKDVEEQPDSNRLICLTPSGRLVTLRVHGHET
jgi:DNA-binding MarR family transcriptional regulator